MLTLWLSHSKLIDWSFREALLRDPDNALIYLEERAVDGDSMIFSAAITQVAEANDLTSEYESSFVTRMGEL
jgi:hypothetical protein